MTASGPGCYWNASLGSSGCCTGCSNCCVGLKPAERSSRVLCWALSVFCGCLVFHGDGAESGLALIRGIVSCVQSSAWLCGWVFPMGCLLYSNPAKAGACGGAVWRTGLCTVWDIRGTSPTDKRLSRVPLVQAGPDSPAGI